MRNLVFCVSAIALLGACQNSDVPSNLNGTYKLLESTTVKGPDTVHLEVDPTKTEMIKMFNDSNFAFFNHDFVKGQDSTALFVSGAGTYTLDGDKYVENLEFCSFRPWEGKQFVFTLHLKGDTIIQEGVEEIPELGIKQHITEKYIKIR